MPSPHPSGLAQMQRAGLNSDNALLRAAQAEHDLLTFEKTMLTTQTAKTVRRGVKWAGRGVEFYKDILSLGREAGHLSKLGKLTLRIAKSPRMKLFGKVSKVALYYCTAVIIIEAMTVDREKGDKRNMLSVPLGRETRWAIGGEALSYTPWSTFIAGPIYQKVRLKAETRRNFALSTNGGKSPARGASWQQRLDRVLVDFL